MNHVSIPKDPDSSVQLRPLVDFRGAVQRTKPYVHAVSFQDFRWACGHVGPAYCKQCHYSSLVKK